MAVRELEESARRIVRKSVCALAGASALSRAVSGGSRVYKDTVVYYSPGLGLGSGALLC